MSSRSPADDRGARGRLRITSRGRSDNRRTTRGRRRFECSWRVAPLSLSGDSTITTGLMVLRMRLVPETAPDAAAPWQPDGRCVRGLGAGAKGGSAALTPSGSGIPCGV